MSLALTTLMAPSLPKQSRILSAKVAVGGCRVVVCLTLGAVERKRLSGDVSNSELIVRQICANGSSGASVVENNTVSSSLLQLYVALHGVHVSHRNGMLRYQAVDCRMWIGCSCTTM